MLVRLVRMAGAGLVLAFLCACDYPSDEELVIISPHSPEIRHEFTQGFEKWHRARTGRRVSVKWLDVGGTGESIEYVRSRNAGGRQSGGVDLFYGGGDYPFIKLQAQDLLLPHVVPDTIRGRIPRSLGGVAVYRDDGAWYGAALSGFGIIYNREIARRNGLAVPRRWEDLARPECYGWVSSGDPRYSGSIHMMYEILLQAYGWERGWDVILRMGANIQSFTKGASSSAKDVSLGQAAFGMAIDFYAFIEIQRYGASRLGFVMPEGETVITPDGIGILRNAPNAETARAFLEYALSEGQKLWILKPGLPGGPESYALCRFPVDSTLYDLDSSLLTVDQSPYRLPSSLHYDATLGGRRWAILGDLIASYVIAPHEELKSCWRRAIRRGMGPEEYGKFLRMDLKENDVTELAAKWSGNEFARERIRLMNEWTAGARERYRAIGGCCE